MWPFNRKPREPDVVGTFGGPPAAAIGVRRLERPCSTQFSGEANAFAICGKCGWKLGEHMQEFLRPGGVHYVDSADYERAPHNPHQQLIPAAPPEEQMTSSELVRAAGDSVPALTKAVTVIATRFEQLVDNLHGMNRALGEFRTDVILPFREELKHLRYNTGDRLTQASTDLEKYVAGLDKILWATLRAQGMTDVQIRTYREEHGMQPEAPTGPELALHLQELEDLRESNAALVRQNQRLLARLDGHHFSPGESEWTEKPACTCSVCREYRSKIDSAMLEATHAPDPRHGA